MIILLYSVHVLICFFLIAVVLLQQGKGADLSVFGGGATQTAFGARGAATVLHKMTVFSFVLFIVTTLAIGVVQSDHGSSGLIEDLDEESAAATTDDKAADTAEGEAAAEEDVQGALAAEPAADEATEGDAETTESADDGAGADEATGDAAEDGGETGGDTEPAAEGGEG